MRPIILVLAAALAAACAKQAESASPAPSVAEAAPVEAPVAPQPPADPFVGKIWAAAGANAPPGAMRVFLEDGALLQDSCFETYRLSAWRRLSDNRIAWSEDGADIEAEIVSVDDAALTLKLMLVGGEQVETFKVADVPMVCPDMPN